MAVERTRRIARTSNVAKGMHQIANSKIGQLFIRIMAAIMESRFRYRFFGPMKILQGAEMHPGQAVLEVGCGTGYFTITTQYFEYTRQRYKKLIHIFG